ncbi:preprotein translocase subunit YajC [Streptomyces sp. SP18CS02]|uniref:preprotein translocase subunit YajC n=1 Tax=Streptomyces sp. SP18CS02 TaxID=3002531 RepID=UPI002E78E762|nr:preprotein translocase subunit YajC [Streptomyces sp. SP18CS02]MEE1752677.1 preprotein translocase subunit YajC [Streptomyces sp. SP18CS02]
MSIVTLLPFIVLIGAMFLMTRSAKKKQQQAAAMRDQMQPGTGVRTIGGMYATVKEVGDDTVLLEVAPGVHALYAKNAIGAVLEDEEYNRIVHGDDLQADSPVVPDDASSLTGPAGAEPEDGKADDTAGEVRPNLSKKAEADDAEPKDGKADGTGDAK